MTAIRAQTAEASARQKVPKSTCRAVLSRTILPAGFEGWDIRLSEDSTQVLLAPTPYRIQYENLLGAKNPNPDSYTVTTPTIELLPPYDMTEYDFLGWAPITVPGGQKAILPATIPQRRKFTLSLLQKESDTAGQQCPQYR